MSYLDQIGNTFQQLYRKPKYIQIGTTRVYEPMRVDFSHMYQRYEIPVMPEAPIPSTYTPPMPQNYVPTVGMGIEQQYPEQAGWQKWNTLEGTEVWMPTQKQNGTPVQEGDIYTNDAGEKYYWSANLNSWLKLKLETNPELGSKVWTIDPQLQPFIGTNRLGDYSGRPVAYETIGQSSSDINETIEGITQNLNTEVDRILYEAFKAAGKEHWWTGNPFPEGSPNYNELERVKSRLREYLNNMQFQNKSLEQVKDDITNIASDLIGSMTARILMANVIINNSGNLITIKGQLDYYNDLLDEAQETEGLGEAQSIATGNIITWTEQYQNLLEKLDSGEISYIDETGNLDTTQLRQMGMVGNWFADVLENSYKTGLISGDIIQYNPDTGKYEFAPEIQEMENQIGLMNEENKRAFQQFNRQLALNAIASGHSLNSGFYSDYTARGIAEYSANVADQISSVMMNEIQSQYQYIANSLKQGLVDIGVNVDMEQFTADIENQWSQIQQQYQQQVEALAQQAAENSAETMGNIVTSAVALAVQTMLALFGGI